MEKRDDRFKPREEIDNRKARFVALNAFVMSRNGWITSIPGEDTVTLETLPDSTLPDELIALGYDRGRDAAACGHRQGPALHLHAALASEAQC